jgi:N4-gp56 family major capsid protein
LSDALTTTSSLASDQTAYDMFAYYALHPELYFDMVADVQPTNQSMPGAAVVFYLMADMSVASTTLNQSVDVDAVALSDSTVTLTLGEYGNVAKTTAKLRGVSYIPLDPAVVNVVAFNAGSSIDTVARDVLKGGTNILYVGQAVSRATVIPTDSFQFTQTSTQFSGAGSVRKAVAKLRGNNAATINGQYVGYIHPDVSYDFRTASGAANWRDPHTYSDPGNIYNGEIGSFEGTRFIETPRAPVFADAGSSTTLTDVYRTLIVGRQAFAKAWSIADGNGPTPRVFPTPIVDNLRRFHGYAWYWLGAYGIFRQESLYAIESSSSIGTNS